MSIAFLTVYREENILYSLPPYNRLPLSEEMQQELLWSDDPDFQAYALRNPYFMKHLLEEIITSKDTLMNSYRKSRLVREVDDESIHLRLMEDSNSEVIISVAEETTFPAVIEKLMGSEDVGVQYALAERRILTPDQVRRLSLVPSSVVHEVLIKSHHTRPLIDGSWGARLVAKWHPDLFEELMGDLDVREAKALAETWRGSVESLREALLLTVR